MSKKEHSSITVSPSYRIVSMSLLTAVTAVFTLIVRVPIAPTRGYINLGDVAIFFTAFTFGPVTALVSGGLGTALADLLAGYAQWAPITLVIHGLQGLIAGIIVKYGFFQPVQNGRIEERAGRFMLMIIAAGIAGTVIMVGLYFLAGAVMYGAGAAAVEIVGNLIQCIVGIAGGYLLNRAVTKAYPPVQNLFL